MNCTEGVKMHINKDTLKQPFSVLIPVYNEDNIVVQNAKKLYDFVKNTGFKEFEILICDNGSNDNTSTICNKLSRKYSEINYRYISIKGIGSGIKTGIKNAKFDVLILLSIDLAFHPKFIAESIDVMRLQKADIVIGSKRHDKSKVKRPFSRKVASFAYNTLVNMLFGLRIVDTQGAVTFKKSSIMSFLKNLNSNNSFFQTQFMIYSKKNNLRVIEIPVSVNDPRKSSFNIKSEAIKLFVQLIREFFRINSRR